MTTSSTLASKLVLFLCTGMLTATVARAQPKKVIKKEFNKVKIVPTNYIEPTGEGYTRDGSYVKIMQLDTLAIPYLIDKLSDTTLTTISYHCDNTKLRRGDIALFLINDIESIPVNVVTGNSYDATGTCDIFPVGFFNAFREKRAQFQESYRTYYYSDARQERIRQVH
jgi:hypothetical protein